MDWSYFRKEPDGFSLKRLPAASQLVRIKDVTELDDYRPDFRGLSFEEGLSLYQHLFDGPDAYELEIDSFNEAADRASASILEGMSPFKGHISDVEELVEGLEPVELELSATATKKAEASGLVAGDQESGYLAGPRLAAEYLKLIQRMVSGIHEAISDMPAPYQEATWRELVVWDGLPCQLSRQAVGAYGGLIGRRVAQEAQANADNYVPGSEYGPPHFDPSLEVHFRYQGPKDSHPKQRRVAVHHIVGIHQVYLKGRCLESNGERSFHGHCIEGEILNTSTGEVIPVDRSTTSQQLREALGSRRTTDAPSGVARPGQTIDTPYPAPQASPAEDRGKRLRNPVPWLLAGTILVWWLMVRQ